MTASKASHQQHSKTAVAAIFAGMLIVGVLIAHFAVTALHRSELRDIAEGSAIKAAQELPLFNAKYEQIQTARRKLTACEVEGVIVKTFAHPSKIERVETTFHDQNTFAQVTVVMRSTSVFARLISIPESKITATAVAKLQGLGEVELIRPVQESQGRAETPDHLKQLSERCGA